MPRLMSVSLTEEAVVERRKTVTRRLGWQNLKPGDRLTLCRKVMGRRRLCDWCHGYGDRARHDAESGKYLGMADCEKCAGTQYMVEPLVKLVDVEVTDVARQQVRVQNTPNEAALEGFPDLTWPEFVAFFCVHMRCEPTTPVTRIEFRYLDQAATDG